MIYNSGYFNKELKEAFIDRTLSYKKILTYGLFIGLLSFAFHFFLQTLADTVLTTTFPALMSPSYFSTIYLYTKIAFYFIAVYLITYYNYLTFFEIKQNRWYILVKMGYNPHKMIFAKYFARTFFILGVYTIGFLTILFLTTFLKYQFLIFYIFPLFLSGLIQILFLLILCLTVSLVLKEQKNIRPFIIIALFVLPLLQVFTGFYDLESNRILMRDVFQLLFSPYIVIMFFSILLLLLYSTKKANHISNYYHNKNNHFNHPIIMKDFKTHEFQPYKKTKVYVPEKFFQKLIIGFFSLTLILSFAMNLFILLMSSTSSGNYFSISGKIPMMFNSSTMNPIIQKNDLAFFEKVDIQYPLNVGDIILFEKDKVIFIESIVQIEGEVIKVDILSYPSNSEPNSMIKYVNRDEIIGKYASNNRWLGVLIVFSNSLIGRIIMIILPAIILFFHKEIAKKFFNKKKKELLPITSSSFYYEEKYLVEIDDNNQSSS